MKLKTTLSNNGKPHSKRATHPGYNLQGLLISKTHKYVGSFQGNYTDMSTALQLTLNLAASRFRMGRGE